MINIGEKKPEMMQQVLDQCKTAGVKFVNMQFTDILGVTKTVTIPVETLPEALQNNIWFDGSSIEGFARIAESDMYLVPDLSTFAVLPWEGGSKATARIICWVFSPNGQPFVGGTRSCLAKAMNEAEDMGFTYNTGPELEFFLFKPDEQGRIAALPHDRAGYFDLSTDLAYEVRKDMVTALQAMGIRVEASHHEVAIGQHEIDFRYGPALQVADNAMTFKTTLKAIAQQNGLHATFMPKPLFGINGSGMHVHQSFFDKSGKNAFVDHSDEYGLSEIAKQFIAGQLAHARGMCAILAPLVNSYKRLVPGYEAPVYISWARVNRSALIRVPNVTAGRDSATRLELRCPDPSCNPYLAMAVMLKAGMDGIKRKLPLPEPVEENLYHFDEAELARRNITMLPATLGDALEEMQKDPLIREALGDHIFERFIEAKTQEWDQYRMYVSPWEIEHYLEMF
jgi:glutamine synthetase